MRTFIAMVAKAPHMVIEDTFPPERPPKKEMLEEPEKIGSTLKERAGSLMIGLIAMTRVAGMRIPESENPKKASIGVMKPRTLANAQRLASSLHQTSPLPQTWWTFLLVPLLFKKLTFRRS